jgi:hypothetical protein
MIETVIGMIETVTGMIDSNRNDRDSNRAAVLDVLPPAAIS